MMDDLPTQSVQEVKSDFPSKKPQNNSPIRVWAKFSSLGIQWTVMLLCAAWVGLKLDDWAGTSRPYLTALTSLLALIGVFRSLLRSLSGLENVGKNLRQPLEKSSGSGQRSDCGGSSL
ncbi:MAG: AtpZ/AtpI family protein [Sphingomonadales bacterium]|nr:AtpZ/AtpI family protein [Sphingomonadales bacterium]